MNRSRRNLATSETMEVCAGGVRGKQRQTRNNVSSFSRNKNTLSGLHADAVLMRIGDFITALDDQHPDKNRLLEIREDVPEPGVLLVRLVPEVPDKRDEAKNLKHLLEGESQNLGDEIKEE